MIKGREQHSKALVKLKPQPPSDLLVCFPTRAHLSLKPKPTYSPSRPNNNNNNHPLRRLSTRAAGSSTAGNGPDSPHVVWSKDNQIRGGGPEMSEPTSPKVTCAGQIKVRPRSSGGACRNWQSVMEEIERIHNSNRSKNKKKSSWGGSFGIKKDVMGFLTCLRNLRFDFHCFGSFPQQILSSDDEEDEDEDEEVVYDEEEDTFEEIIDDNNADEFNNNNKVNDDNNNNNNNSNNAVFSKWFMVLQENQSDSNCSNNKLATEDVENEDFAPAVPPPNALLLMRCRSAPAKSRLEEKENDEEKAVAVENGDEDDEKEEKIKKKKRETLAIVMKYDTDFYKLSTDVAHETWVVGEFKDPFSRSRSWRR
ncbi:hypothetical protein vseg_009140 [Gypsophila vaccaria]